MMYLFGWSVEGPVDIRIAHGKTLSFLTESLLTKLLPSAFLC
ncbi:hypothetical protein CYFUS_005363 [Cystobacter fuscus]|uniref:Uncharacterized protein n=1 Tax=Cystobacter fuscus TaxID=43 RepID=A0A250J7L6_9BACT|nr:hypothetical protein CYFUS_005363 [Cystobacter fuscus]